jgi:hypothetical protein
LVGTGTMWRHLIWRTDFVPPCSSISIQHHKSFMPERNKKKLPNQPSEEIGFRYAAPDTSTETGRSHTIVTIYSVFASLKLGSITLIIGQETDEVKTIAQFSLSTDFPWSWYISISRTFTKMPPIQSSEATMVRGSFLSRTTTAKPRFTKPFRRDVTRALSN